MEYMLRFDENVFFFLSSKAEVSEWITEITEFD